MSFIVYLSFSLYVVCILMSYLPAIVIFAVSKLLNESTSLLVGVTGSKRLAATLVERLTALQRGDIWPDRLVVVQLGP